MTEHAGVTAPTATATDGVAGGHDEASEVVISFDVWKKWLTDELTASPDTP
jgi:hypothetical protein